MMVKENDFEVLEQRFSMYVIMMVGTYPGCIKSDIGPLGDPKRNTKFARIEYLKEVGYIENVSINEKETNKLQLTEKGLKIYESIKSIHEILTDE